MTDTVYDVIVVGAGAAGCVLASRLSEDPQCRVLLIEAGADAPPGREHPDIADPFPVSFGNPAFSWPALKAETGVDPGDGRPRASRHYLQGRGVGGGTNINGSIAFRGQPSDYDAWQEMGAQGWSWHDVLPYFRKLETDLDFEGPMHGHSAPVIVRRRPPEEWAPFSRAVGQALLDRGHRSIADYNGDFGDGLSALPMTNRPDRRVSASSAYLSDDVRRRPNLRLITDATVEQLDLQGRRAQGVLVRRGDGVSRLRARETVVSCSGIFSPALLLRSGIGPADQLQALGLSVAHHLPGVGSNLQNHPKIEVAVHLPRISRQPAAQRDLGQNCLRYSSGLEGCAAHDMGIVSINRASWHRLGASIGAVGAALYAPLSRGDVTLTSADPQAMPRVRFALLSAALDFERMVSGLQLLLRLLADPSVVAVRHEAFFPGGGMVRRLAHRRPATKWQAAALATLLDLPWVRRQGLRRTAIEIDTLLRDEAMLRERVREHAGMSHHFSGTCRMGHSNDPMAVLDSSCRVRGVEGLRVVDASAFPQIVRAGMYLPVMMFAERVADLIKAERRADAAPH